MQREQREDRPDREQKSMSVSGQIRADNQPERIQDVRSWAGIKNLLQIRKESPKVIEVFETHERQRVPAPKNDSTGQRGHKSQGDAAALPVGDASLQQQRAREGGAEKVQVEGGKNQPPASDANPGIATRRYSAGHQ